MVKPIINFHYPKAIKLQTKQKTFVEAIEFVLNREEPTNFTPYKIVFESTGKTLYFDETKFKALLAGELTEQEVIFETECDGLYRNEVDIEITKHDIIDTGALWKLKEGKFILIDTERYLPIKAPDSNFVEV